MKKTMKRWLFPIIIALIFASLAIFSSDTAERSLNVTFDYLKEMALIMPPVFLLMGLIEVWVPTNKIEKWLGHGSHVKGGLLSVALGTLPTGPLYVAFPMAASLLKKGASVTNMVLFLGAWAALKIPQIMVEVEFLGVAFAGLRFVLTLIALVITGLLMEFILKRQADQDWLPKIDNENQ